ncbi:T9SS type A sorting domain-containing protein [Flavobacterium sp.]|uniref:T9SS type A sorting domain-containing protein n=1 Tax=Flavobacterium sp. TaxID=239 RepID=UPI0040343AAB
MKKTLLSAVLLLSLNAFAQAPIQAFYSASVIPEDDNTTHYLLVNPSAPLDHDTNGNGNNFVWNFNNLNVVTTTATSVMAPTAGDLANYPGTTMVVETITQGGNPTHYYLSDIGQGTNIKGAQTSQLILKYTTGGLIGNFPMNFGEQMMGGVTGTFQGNGIEGTFTGTSLTNVDAFGTLTVNQGFAGPKEVTRLTIQQFLTLYYMGVEVGTVNQTIYSYYSADLVAGPVMRDITTHTVVAVAGIDQTQNSVEVYDQATNGANDHISLAKTFIAPNPVQDIMHIEGAAEVGSVTITDVMGRTVVRGQGNDVAVSQLPAGIYHVAVVAEGRSSTLKMVKQ